MAYDYNRAKQVWDSMNDQQKKQYTEQNKNDANFQQFAQQYHEEKQQTAPRQVQANVNVDNLQNNQPQKQQQVINTQTESEQQPLAQRDANWVYTGNTEWEKEQNRKMLEEWQRRQAEEQKKINNKIVNASPEFDSSRLTNPNAEVSVKEGNAAQTWTPDYEEDSEARMNEITNNLNAYWNTNKSYFSDRATFNSTFHYNDRSAKQKALLDSFWKWTQDQVKANTYRSWDDVMIGFENWDITPDIMSYLRTYNEAAYDEWQKKMENQLNLRIANMATPPNPWNTVDLWNDLVKKLWLEQWDPYKIYDNWVWRCEQLWVFNMNNQLSSYIAEMDSVKNERTRAIQRTMSQWAWKKSQALINAEVAKTSAIYDTRFADLQRQYQAVYNQRQQNLAIANQSAQALQMQGAEDSRIFNQKLAWLGFAMQADSYRTPEQQAQLQLQTAQIQNDLNLLNQGNRDQLDLYKQRQLNQLEITHMHDLAEAQDQINFERTDLTVENEGQLRVNLSNVLDQYYSAYWDIIKRPKSQVIEDVLAYAREHNVSVAEALKKDFIEPLQWKTEYKNMLSSKYAAPVKSWVTVNSDWSIDFWVTTEWWLTYTPITSTQLYWWFRDFVDSKKVWDKWWQCWKFVNDYLQSMWFNRIYKDSISSKLNSINTDKNDLDNLSVWSVAVFDYAWVNWVSENSKKYGHVAIVTEIDKANNRVKVIESNNKWDEKISTRWVSLNGNALKWFFDPSKWSDTPSDNPNLAKDINAQALLKQIETWQITDTKISEAREELVAKWYGQEFMNALNRWFKVNLNEAQNKMLDTTLNRFNSNQIVKDFESAGNQIWNLIEALNANNWVWDTAAIFTFMKVLDPSSVVRESEFENAASTAWYTNPKALWQKYVSHGWDGTWLTDAQRGNFKEFAKSLIKSQSKMYQQKYDDAIRYLNNANIDEMWYPTNYADLIIKSLEDSWSSKVSFNSNTKNNINWYEQYTSWGNNNQVYSDWLPNNFYSFWS